MDTSDLIEQVFDACVAAEAGFPGAAKWAAELIARERPERRGGGMLDFATAKRVVARRPRDMYAHG